MAGCCHGAKTEAWYGVYFVSYRVKAVPIQLFESIFLFVLFGLFCYRIIRKKSCNLPLYMILYGTWRFCVEFLRGDDRGATIVSFLTPSQLIAVLMVLGSVALFFGERKLEKKQKLTIDEESDKKEEIKNEG
jgi:phosphatidylglycerol:prolipoprotein diacylglycerol transferase